MRTSGFSGSTGRRSKICARAKLAYDDSCCAIAESVAQCSHWKTILPLERTIMAHWVDELADAEQLAEAKANASAVEAVTAGIRVQAEASEFLRLFEMELREIARKLAEKPNLHLFASVSDSSEPEIETRLHVQVSSTAGWPEVTYTDLFHLQGQTVIRCHTAEGTAFRLRFAARSSGGRSASMPRMATGE
jgi:hypothetical protein